MTDEEKQQFKQEIIAEIKEKLTIETFPSRDTDDIIDINLVYDNEVISTDTLDLR